MENLKSKIIRIYLSSRFSKETEEKVQRWIIKDDNIKETEQDSYKYWENLDAQPDKNTYAALKNVNSKIGYEKPKIPIRRILLRVAAVLVPLALILGGYTYYMSEKNGWTEIIVAYGEERHLFLPDSSEIWINSGSTVKYPKNFEGEERTVHLKGEAYFSVVKNTQKPFIVQTEKLDIKVLGTKFNVKAYADDENTVTTLTSGKVEVNTQANQTEILKPNEQFVLNNKTLEKSIKVITTEETTAWMSGDLIFNNASPKEIFQTLERKFNITFEIDKSISFGDKRYTVKFLKKDSLENIMDILEEVMGGFSYKIEKNKVVINKRN